MIPRSTKGRSKFQGLQEQDIFALSHPEALTGLGGIGKTQLALEYAYRHRDEYTGVFWVQANLPETLFSSFVELARVLNLLESNENDQNLTIEAVLYWFHSHTGWLLIFDNMDDPLIAEPFIPRTSAGHVLLTTRAQSLNNLAGILEVAPLDTEAGALLLLRKAGKLSPQALLAEASQELQIEALAIAQELQGLPLALDQAGAYIQATLCSLEDYLAYFRTRRQRFLQERGSSSPDYAESVATTWALALEKVEQEQPAAGELFNFCAFLAPDAIPESILTESAPHLGETLAEAATKPLLFYALLATLNKYSLIQYLGNQHILNMHRLVQAVVQDNLPPETRSRWKQRVVLAVNTAMPDIEDASVWSVCEKWLPHALTCSSWIEQERLGRGECAALLSQTGWYLCRRGRYSPAETLLRRAAAMLEFIAAHWLFANRRQWSSPVLC